MACCKRLVYALGGCLLWSCAQVKKAGITLQLLQRSRHPLGPPPSPCTSTEYASGMPEPTTKFMKPPFPSAPCGQGRSASVSRCQSPTQPRRLLAQETYLSNCHAYTTVTTGLARGSSVTSMDWLDDANTSWPPACANALRNRAARQWLLLCRSSSACRVLWTRRVLAEAAHDSFKSSPMMHTVWRSWVKSLRAVRRLFL